MANTEFTTAPPKEVMAAQIASAQNVLLADAAITPPPADEQSSHVEPSAPADFRPRQLKISYLPLAHDAVPFLRLSGKWMAEAGFQIGSDVRVSVTSERLVIEPHAPEFETQAQIRENRRAALRNRASLDCSTASTLYPAFDGVEMVRDAVSSYSGTDQQERPDVMKRRSHARSQSYKVKETGGTWSKRIAAGLEPALGDLLAEERSRVELSRQAMASYAEIGESNYRAIDRGDRQPNLSTFIAIAWTLGQDPRELFDKLLLQMGLPTGTRPIIRPVTIDFPRE